MTETLTVKQILKRVNDRRPYCRASLLTLMKRLQIGPVEKFRTKPYHYPPDTPDKILSELGVRLVTLTQLRSVRNKAQQHRRAA